MMATLAGAIAFGGVGATLAQAESRSNDAALQALSSASVALADAIRTAEAAGQGMVTGAEFDLTKDGAFYDVTTRNGTTEVDHRIDPSVGAILASTLDAEDDDGDREADEAPELAAIQGAQVSLLDAIATAEAQGAKVLGAEYEFEDGALGIELKTADASGAASEQMVNATRGAVMPGDHASVDEENAG